MGWSTVRRTFPSKVEAVIQVEGFQRADIIASSECIDAAYLAIQVADGMEMRVVAAVCLVEEKDGETSVKVMGEDAFPYYFRASKKVLAALTPPKTDEAKKWRAACRRHNRPAPRIRPRDLAL